MATHFSIHAYRIPWTEKPGGLQSIGSQSVRHKGSSLSQMHTCVYSFSSMVANLGYPCWGPRVLKKDSCLGASPKDSEEIGVKCCLEVDF